ncbi:MAG: GAF domain-containing protein [Chloroflexi bacterium]|nr:GAF domain-containing protein [Chloroflexota bacterium]
MGPPGRNQPHFEFGHQRGHGAALHHQASRRFNGRGSRFYFAARPQTRQLHFRASSNAGHQEMAAIPVPLDSSIAGAILTENRPMLISDVSKEPRWNPTASQSIQFETQAILGVPMHDVERKPIGGVGGAQQTKRPFQP